MKNRLWLVAAVGVLSLGGAAVAIAGTGKKTTTKAARTSTTSTTTRPIRTPETPLTGDVATQAKAAAVASAGAGSTADLATTENDSSVAGATYEVHVTKADGTHVTVILDSSFKVLATETGGPGGHGFGGPHGGPGNGETPLTGDVAAKAKAAAVAKVGSGSTAEFASTETDSSLSGAAYEVHVTKADGTHVEVILDQDDNVLAVDTAPAGGPGFGHGGRH
jgi:uncharacterized membrane protein YkoI